MALVEASRALVPLEDPEVEAAGASLLRLLQQSRACPEPLRVREDVSEQVAVERDEPGDTLAFFCDPDLGRRDEVAQEAPVLLARVQARQVREHLLAGPCEDLVQAVQVARGRSAQPHRGVI